nr:DUF1493 family protein [Burkholderia ubonensis]
MNTTHARLEAFIRHATGMSTNRPLKPTDRLESDLDITGDDADDFMGAFFDQFSVEPGDYRFDRYFSEEGFNPFAIALLLFSKKARQRYEKEPLTVAMLEHAIELGVWDSRKLAGRDS